MKQMILLPLSVLLLLILPHTRVNAGAFVERGKIQLIGIIDSVNVRKHTFTMAVHGYADERSNHYTIFDKPRLKTVKFLNGTCSIYSSGQKVIAARLRAGIPVMVDAKAVGTGVGRPVTDETVMLFLKGNAPDSNTDYKHILAGQERYMENGHFVYH